MKRTFSKIAWALVLCAGARAATISTTLTVNNATITIGATGYGLSGTATLTNIGSGAMAGNLTPVASGFSGTITITLPGTDKITGILALPTSAISASGTGFTGGTVTVTGTSLGGVGVTGGSFPAMSGSGSIGATGITVSFTGAGTITTGGTPPAAVPTITAVQDAASNTVNIAQGSIFIVKGSTLSASGFTSYAPPRPTAPSGVKVTFTPQGGGAGTDAYIVYLYNQSGVNQIAAILPSTVAVGTYNVTVTNGTVSAPFVAKVVDTKIGLFTQDSSGTGLASVQNYISQTVVDLNRLTTGSISGVTYSPAKPGQPVIAYGTGLGGYAAGDNTASPLKDFRSSLTIKAIVGGTTIPVDYAGRAGYAGEDQINFTLPSNIQTGCAVSLQISVNGVLSAPTSIAIAPDSGSSACVFPGYTTAQLQKLDQGGTITSGGFSITQFTVSAPSFGTEKINSIGGGFSQLTAYQLSSAVQGNVSLIQSGSCQVITVTSSGSSTSTGSSTELDAGVVTINGPSGSGLSNLALTKTNNSYGIQNIEGLTIPGQTAFTLPAGSYTLTGAGGTDVGTFSTSITLATPLTLSSPLPSNVVRSTPLTLNWTGGNASDLVEIIGSTSTSTGGGTTTVTTTTEFICVTTAGAKTFTVPASVLSYLQPTTGSNTGLLEVASGNVGNTFTASLKAGGSIDNGTFSSFIGIGSLPTYQ